MNDFKKMKYIEYLKDGVLWPTDVDDQAVNCLIYYYYQTV